MRITLRLAAATVAAFVLAALAYAWVVLSELQVAEYPTLAAARTDGAIARGWIPAWMPDSARRLREVHDLDTNERWLALTVSPEYWWDVLRIAWPMGLRPVPEDSAASYMTRPPRALREVWPKELSDPPRSRSWEWRFVTLFRMPDERYCLAIDWKTGRGWGWSCEAAG